MKLTWIDDDTGHLRKTDEADEVVGVLSFNEATCGWYLYPSSDTSSPGYNVDVDHDQSYALWKEREELALTEERVRDALVAEWRGRVHMFRDETRDLAAMGAKIIARRFP